MDSSIASSDDACSSETLKCDDHDRLRRLAAEIWNNPDHLSRLRSYAAACIRQCSWRGINLNVDADDMVQHAATVLLEGKLKCLGTPADMLPVLLVVISNCCRNLIQQHNRRARHANQWSTAESSSDWDTKDMELDIANAVAALPARRRSACSAILLASDSPIAYASKSGISAQTARNYVDRAKPFLRDRLRDYRLEG